MHGNKTQFFELFRHCIQLDGIDSDFYAFYGFINLQENVTFELILNESPDSRRWKKLGEPSADNLSHVLN